MLEMDVIWEKKVYRIGFQHVFSFAERRPSKSLKFDSRLAYVKYRNTKKRQKEMGFSLLIIVVVEK